MTTYGRLDASGLRGRAVKVWRDAALCRLFDNLPWIEDADRVTPADTACMGTVCAACPVVFECGDFAACEGVTSGFWAGRDRTPPGLVMDGVA